MIEDTVTTNLEEFVKSLSNSKGSFSPVAYYDKHMDCIRVQLFDCSFTEERMNKFITVLHANHHEIDKFAGFNIKGIRYLFEQLGLPVSGVHKLTNIVDLLVKHYPDSSTMKVKNLFEPILNHENLQVEFCKLAV
ncbi:hypothetical protein ARNL5_01854 [Anaerolineae bacterium]|nr:hypothetical protein ARNL5_01854 [Anaerolineae bacterium]